MRRKKRDGWLRHKKQTGKPFNFTSLYILGTGAKRRASKYTPQMWSYKRRVYSEVISSGSRIENNSWRIHALNENRLTFATRV